MLVIPFPPIPNVTEEAMHWMRGLMAGFWLSVALVGVWWLILFSRPRIVALFKTEADAASSEPARPLSIMILGGLFIFGATVGFGFQLAIHTPFVIFGQMVQGTPGNLLNLMLAIVYGILGAGLLRLDRRAYFGTLGLFAYGVVNALFMSLLPNRLERMQALLRTNPGYDPKQFAGMSWMFSPWYTAIMCVIFLGIPAYFLITRRTAFDKAPPAEASASLIV